MRTAKVAAYDLDGHFLAVVPAGYVTRALAAGEVARIPDGVTLRPSAVRAGEPAPLSPEAKRRVFLAKQRRR